MARQAELPVSLSAVGNLIEGFSIAPATSGVKSIFTKNHYIMNSIAGIIVVGTASLLVYFNQPHYSPKKQATPTVLVDSVVKDPQSTGLGPDTNVKHSESKKNQAEKPELLPNTSTTKLCNTEASLPEGSDNDTAKVALTDINPETKVTGINKENPIKQNCAKKNSGENPNDLLEDVTRFSYNEGLWAMANSEGLYGMIDREANIVVPIIYDQIDKKFKYNNKLWCRVSRNGLFGFIDTEGREVVPTIYDEVNDFLENDKLWARVIRNGLVGFIDMEGKEVVPANYDDITDYNENDGLWARAHRQGNLYFLNREGKEVVLKSK